MIIEIENWLNETKTIIDKAKTAEELKDIQDVLTLCIQHEIESKNDEME